jgi:hypothetical protein
LSPVAGGTSVLVKPDVAAAQVAAAGADAGEAKGGLPTGGTESGGGMPGPAEPGKPTPSHFYGRKTVNAARLPRDAGEIATEVVTHLIALAGVDVEVTIEISARGSEFDDSVVRVVTENAKALRFDSAEFE